MIELWDLAPSPNNTKVRMALRYKGLDFEAIPVDVMDRGPVVEVSGQELTPVIRDKGIVLNDSEAILNYLDANYRDTPRLMPSDRAGRKECDAWKAELDEKVARHWMGPFFYAIKMRDSLDQDALKAFHDSLAWLDELIGERDSFKDGPDRAVCDLRVAEWATYALPGEGLVARCPLFKVFAQVFGVEPGSLPNLERFLKPWNERLA